MECPQFGKAGIHQGQNLVARGIVLGQHPDFHQLPPRALHIKRIGAVQIRLSGFDRCDCVSLCQVGLDQIGQIPGLKRSLILLVFNGIQDLLGMLRRFAGNRVVSIPRDAFLMG